MYTMLTKIYLILLIICASFSQGVIGKFAEEDIKESSHLLRNKRLISNNHHGVVRIPITQAPYVVKVLKDDYYICVGTILLSQVILTAAHCLHNPGTYSILSGSTHVHKGTHHNITTTIIHPNYNETALANDLALLYIYPHIDVTQPFNRIIRMQYGFLPPRTVAHVSSWGCIGEDNNGLVLPNRLRSITTRIISQEECHRIQNEHPYHPIAITDKDICTFDVVNGNRCSHGDSGAPLVVSNLLVGILAWNRAISHGPDVFMNLSHPAYRFWILENLPPNPSSPFYTRRH